MARRPFTRLKRFGFIVGTVLLIGFGVLIAGINLWAEHHYQTALRDLERYHLVEGRDHLAKCLLVWPNSGRVHLLAGRAARQAGDFQEAEDHYEAAKSLLQNSDALHLEWVLLKAQKGDTKGTEVSLRPYFDQDTSEAALVLEVVTRGSMETLRLAEAHYFLGLWLERQPNNVLAHILRARVKEQAGGATDALADYRRVLELDPDNADALVGLAADLVELNMALDAIPYLERLESLQPGNLRGRVLLARSRMSEGKPEEAQHVLDDILAHNPDFEQALVARGMLAFQEGKSDEARTWLRRALRRDPGNYQALYTLAQCLEHMGKAQEAKSVHAKMIQVEKDYRRFHAILTQEMSRDPNDPNLHYELGMIQLRLGNENEALKWFASALDQDADLQPAHEALYEHYIRVGDYREAAKHRAYVPAEKLTRSGEEGKQS